MFNVRHFAADGTETPVAAAKYEIVGTAVGSPVTVKAWANILDAEPSHGWTGARGDGSSPGQAMCLITNRFGQTLETVYLLP